MKQKKVSVFLAIFMTIMIMVSFCSFGFVATQAEILHKTWQVVGNAEFSMAANGKVSMSVDNGIPYVAFSDVENSNKITVMKLVGNSWQAVGNAGFSNGEALNISISMDIDGNPIVSYIDAGELFVKKFNETWVDFGINSHAGVVSSVIVNGVLYVAYTDTDNASKITIKKYQGGTWVDLGNAGFSDGSITDLSIAFYDGIVYVTGNYVDKAIVMQYNNGIWSSIGELNFPVSDDNSYRTAFIVNNVGKYITYWSMNNPNKATVYQCSSNGIWTALGLDGFSTGVTFFNQLASDSGIPYIAYSDPDAQKQFTVMSYIEGVWQDVGSESLADGLKFLSAFTIDNSIPYTAFFDAENSKVSVLKYDIAILSKVDTLKGLVPSNGTLSPEFSENTYEYSLIVEAAVDTIKLTPTVNDINSSVTINDTSVVSGNESESLSLSYGLNSINVKVTAQDTNYVKNYIVNVKRLSPQMEVIAVVVSSEGVCTATIVSNKQERSLVLFALVDSENRTKSVYLQNDALIETIPMDFVHTFSNASAGDKVKVFVWNTIDGIRPFSLPKTSDSI